MASPARQRMFDWIAHAKGCRSRAHEYRRWAAEDAKAGRVQRSAYYRNCAARQFIGALAAIDNARLWAR